MRLSVESDDKSYMNPFPRGRVTVTLDGEDITKHCFTADEELGEVLLRKVNSDGSSYYDKETDSFPHEVHTGKVEIEIRPPS